MKVRSILLALLIIVLLLFIGMALSTRTANAAPYAQGFVTSTPGPDGRILYTVVDGDSCLKVALLHGITLPQLRQLNTRLDENCTLFVGQQLVVGLAQSNAPTAGPAPTLPPPTVTATPISGTTEVCVLLFDDMNGDALRQETEFGIDGGAVSLTNLNGSYSQTQNTSSATDPDTLEPVRTFPIECKVHTKSRDPIYFESEQVQQLVAFPRYKMYLYNTVNTSVEANVYLYL